MNRIEGAISANLASLWKQEDELIGWSLGVVAKHEHLIDHFSSIDLYLDAIDFGRQQKMETRRHIAINGLFLRTFDSLSHGLRANLCGNYTGGAMYARDLLETNFLIDFLLDDPERV